MICIIHNINYLNGLHFDVNLYLLVIVQNIILHYHIRGFGKPNEREQAHMKEYVEHKSTNDENASTMNANGNIRRSTRNV